MANYTSDERYTEFVKLDMNVYKNGGYRICAYECSEQYRSLANIKNDRTTEKGGADDSNNPFGNLPPTPKGQTQNDIGKSKGKKNDEEVADSGAGAVVVLV